MNAGEPPDEEGDDEVEERSTDPSGDTGSDETAGDPSEDAADGADDELDPAQEVEAAVEDVMGPGVLDGDGDTDESESEGEEDEDTSSDGALSSDDAEDAGAESAPAEETPSDDLDGVDGDVDGADGDGDDDVASGESVDDDDVDDDDVDDDDVNGDESVDADVDDGSSGDEGEEEEDVASDDGDDAGPAPGDGDSFRRDEPLSVDDDPADDDGVDESAAVQAAQELVESERAGETPDDREAESTDDGAESTAAEEGDGSSATADAEATAGAADADEAVAGPGVAQDADGVEEPAEDVPADVRKYDRFKKIDGGTYDRANEFLRDRTYITAREWAMARLCADFRTETGVEMTKIGENLPELVPFMTDTYTPQAVNQARAAFEEKVRKAGATFLYGAMCDFFTAEELDDVMYEATEVAKFLLEVEGVELSVEEELAAEDHISEVMRDVREHSAALRHDEVTCPECGHEINADD